jgi:hypothetical protein
MEVVQLIGAPLDAGFRAKASGSGEMELHDQPRSGNPATANSPHMLQRADHIIRVDRHTTSWHCPHSFQSAMEVKWQLLMLWDIRRYVQDGFLKVSQPSTDIKVKPSVLNCWRF